MRRREDSWRALGASQVDVLVIGGGITGVGVARDAALRGLSVALVEMRDLAYGTSSRSTKLVHGGLRYLEQGDVGLVFESVNERLVLSKLAPHVVRPLGFVLPVFENAERSLAIVDAGLFIYDALSLFRSPKLHRRLPKAELQREEPALSTQGLEGAALYYDCATDDARLTVEVALDAARHGANVCTWARVVGMLRDEGGAIVGAKVRCELTGREKEVRARAVVNATGPWTDATLRLAGHAGSHVLRPTKGIHIVVPRAKLPLEFGVLLQHPDDARVMFAIPWGERSYIGTTDTDADGDPSETRATGKDVDYVLRAAASYFPAHPISRADILATWAGLRPLLAPPEKGDHLSESQVSREHHLFVDRDGLVTIAGGKLTTFRVMAMETVDAVVKRIDGPKVSKVRHDRRTRHPLASAADVSDVDVRTQLERSTSIASGGRLGPAEVAHLVQLYGTRALDVAVYVAREPRLAARLDPELPDVLAAVHHAVDAELASTVEDVLVRRTSLFFRAADQGLGAAPTVAAELRRLLGLDESAAAEQVARFAADVERSRAYRRE